MKRLLFFFIIFILSSENIHAKSKGLLLYIDNPTDKIVAFKIDNSIEITIEPFDCDSIYLNIGPHSIQYESHQSSFVFMESGSILNPTRSNYIIEEFSFNFDKKSNRINYVTQDLGDDIIHKLPYDTIYVTRYMVAGHIKLIKGDILIPKEWDYGIINPFSNRTNGLNDTTTYTAVKIYRVAGSCFEYW